MMKDGLEIDGDADHEILEIPIHECDHRKQLHAFSREGVREGWMYMRMLKRYIGV